MARFDLFAARRPGSSAVAPAAVRARARRHRLGAAPGLVVGGGMFGALALLVGVWAPAAGAAQTVNLGTAAPFAVLAGTAVTDIPTSHITGDVGLSPHPGSDITGLTSNEVTGTIYAPDASGPGGSIAAPGVLTQAKSDLMTAWVTASGLPPVTTYAGSDNQLGGQTLTAGVYAFGHASSANITSASPLTLDGQGDAGAVFVFQATSDLITSTGSVVRLVNGAQACNVYWEVGSSATLDTGSTFVGTLMALTSATLGSSVTVQGRILASNGDVTLDADTIIAPTACARSTAPASTSGTTAATTAGTAPTATASGTSGGGTGTGGITSAGSGAKVTGPGATGSAGGDTGTPGVAAAVVPVGYPHTGAGGAARAGDPALVAVGALALAGAAGAMALAVRRRRSTPVPCRPDDGR